MNSEWPGDWATSISLCQTPPNSLVPFVIQSSTIHPPHPSGHRQPDNNKSHSKCRNLPTNYISNTPYRNHLHINVYVHQYIPLTWCMTVELLQNNTKTTISTHVIRNFTFTLHFSSKWYSPIASNGVVTSTRCFWSQVAAPDWLTNLPSRASLRAHKGGWCYLSTPLNPLYSLISAGVVLIRGMAPSDRLQRRADSLPQADWVFSNQLFCACNCL